MDDQSFRDLMAGVCAPVTVVTTADGVQPHGATVSSLASLSLSPALISIALDKRSSLLARILDSGRFGVNILHASQADVASVFASRNPDRFDTVGWSASEGLPRIDEAAGWAACALWQSVDAGDHLLLIGHVTHASSTRQAPLVYAHRTFGTHSGLDALPRDPVFEHILACSR